MSKPIKPRDICLYCSGATQITREGHGGRAIQTLILIGSRLLCVNVKDCCVHVKAYRVNVKLSYVCETCCASLKTIRSHVKMRF